MAFITVSQFMLQIDISISSSVEAEGIKLNFNSVNLQE